MELNSINKYINIVRKVVNKKNYPLVISLQNTVSSSPDKQSLYFLPIRVFKNYIFAGICNGNKMENYEFLEKMQFMSTYVLVDVEKKFPWIASHELELEYHGNIEGVLEKHIDTKKLIHIWPNSMTVDSCLKQISSKNRNLSASKIAVIGVGNIGFKLTLRLIEAGCKVSISSRDFDRTLDLANTINRIKPRSTISSPVTHRTTSTCVIDQEYIIFCTGATIKIDKVLINNIKANTTIFTLSRININEEVENLIKKKNISIQTIDITPFYFLEITKKIAFDCSPKPLRVKSNNKFLISGGFNGKNGDVVVDNANQPSIVLGTISQDGRFLRQIDTWEDWISHN